MLQHQFSDAQVKLCDSNRQCQELQSAIKRKDQVSDHNFNNIAMQSTMTAIEQTPTTATFVSQYSSLPTNTTINSAASTSFIQTLHTSTYIAAVPMQAANNSLGHRVFCDTNTYTSSVQATQI